MQNKEFDYSELTINLLEKMLMLPDRSYEKIETITDLLEMDMSPSDLFEEYQSGTFSGILEICDKNGKEPKNVDSKSTGEYTLYLKGAPYRTPVPLASHKRVRGLLKIFSLMVKDELSYDIYTQYKKVKTDYQDISESYDRLLLLVQDLTGLELSSRDRLSYAKEMSPKRYKFVRFIATRLFGKFKNK